MPVASSSARASATVDHAAATAIDQPYHPNVIATPQGSLSIWSSVGRWSRSLAPQSSRSGSFSALTGVPFAQHPVHARHADPSLLAVSAALTPSSFNFGRLPPDGRRTVLVAP